MNRFFKTSLIAGGIFLIAAYVIPFAIKVACWLLLGLFHLAA